MLSKFSKRERTEIDVTLEQAADAVELIVTDGIDAAMNRYNGGCTRQSTTEHVTGSRSRRPDVTCSGERGTVP